MAEHGEAVSDQQRKSAAGSAPPVEAASSEAEPVQRLAVGPAADGGNGDPESRHAALLGDARLAQPGGGGSTRIRLVRQLQRGYGNAYTARVVARLSTEPGVVQRAPAPPAPADTRKDAPPGGGTGGGQPASNSSAGGTPPSSGAGPAPAGGGSAGGSAGGVPAQSGGSNAAPVAAPPAPAADAGGASVEYAAFQTAAQQTKTQMLTAATERNQRITRAADAEKVAVRQVIDEHVKRLGDLYDNGIKRAQDSTERIRGQITSARDAKLAEIRSNTETETGNLTSIIQANQQAIRDIAAGKAKEATDGGETEAGRSTAGSQQRADQAQAYAQEKVRQFAGMPEGAEISSTVQANMPQLVQGFEQTGAQLAAMARRDSTAMAGHFKDEAEKLATGEFAKPLDKGRAKIKELGDEAVKDVNKLAQDALTELDKQSASLLKDLRAGKDRDAEALRQSLPLALDDIAGGAKNAQDKVDEKTRQAAEDVDHFTTELSRASADGPFVTEAKDGLTQAVAQHSAELDSFVGSAVSAFPTGTSQARDASAAMVDKVGGSIDKVIGFFENSANELATKLTQQAGEVSKKALDGMRDITREAMDKLSEGIKQATEKWATQLNDGLRTIRNKIDIGLAKEDIALAQFRTKLEAKASELAKQSRSSVAGAVGSALLAVGKFLLGTIVGFFEGAWVALKAIWELIKTPLFWIVVAVLAVVLIAAILYFGWAAVAGFLSQALTYIVYAGIAAGIGFAIYYLYLMITKPNLSAYERGKLFGRAIFEIVLAFAGTGVWARMGRFFAEIGQIAKIIDRIGNIARAVRLFSRIRNLELLVNLLDKVGESEKLLQMLDKVGDAEKLLALINKVGDAELTFKLLEKVPSAEKLFTLLERVPKADKLATLLEKVADSDKLIKLLEKIPNADELLTLLGKVPNVDQLLPLVEKVPNAQKLLGLLEKVPNAETLAKLLEKIPNPDQLTTLLGVVKDPDKLLQMVEKVPDFTKLQRLLSKVRDADKLLQLLEKVPDGDKLLELLDLIEAVTGSADADKALQALTEVPDIDLLLLSIDPANKGGKLVTAKGLAEGRFGQDVARSGKVPGPLKRDPTGAAEFLDANRTPWDVKGPNSGRPRAQGGFDLTRDADKIAAEIAAGENVIVDTSKMSAADVAALQAEVARRGLAGKVVFHP